VPRERRATEVSDALWIKHVDVDGRLRGSMGSGAGINSIDLANAFKAAREAVEELEARIVALETQLAGEDGGEAEGDSS
jgi:hypothetical protein